MADTEIVVLAEAGEWVKCVVHRGAAHADALAQGWCLRHDAVQVFVVEDSNAYPARQRHTLSHKRTQRPFFLRIWPSDL